MSIKVHSETGRLKQVMLHRPGRELEHLVPDDLERLLFDDIPYLKAAQREHDLFAELLRSRGVEVIYLEDLMADVLRQDSQLKSRFIRQFINEGGITDLRIMENLFSYLQEIPDEKELVMKLMAGVRDDELKVSSRGPLAEKTRRTSRFLLDPIPNLYFTRDPFACIGTGVSVNHMYSATRRRETIFGDAVLKYHPEFAGRTAFYYDRNLPYSIEGGDILNLSSRVLAIGISQRTAPEAVEQLCKSLFTDESSGIETVLALDIPAVRAYMHLDTVFTQVDRDKFTIHPGILSTLRIFEIRRGIRGVSLAVRELEKPLEEILQDYLEQDRISLIHCGGRDRIASEREQWNDGSNTLCIEPGTVITYDRNYVTNQILRDHGINVLETASSELSRGRGGPRCMSMPIVRES